MADCLAITGATATGKTDIAIAIAQQLNGEIISLDSRQIYREMDIGTAKPTAAQQAAVSHFGLDLLPPSERYSAGRFAEDARRWMHEIIARGHLPLLVGGTGFFLRALTHPMFQEPDLDAERKERLRAYLGGLEREELVRWLEALDADGGGRLHADAGRQRITRMLEVVLMTGRSLGWWHAHSSSEADPAVPLTVVLDLPRDILYERINQRVLQMIEHGLPDEVARLLAAGYDEDAPGMNTTGYTELIPYVRGETSLEEAVEAIQRATRAYARRQLTWFRHQLSGPVVHIDASLPQAQVIESIVNEWREHAAHRD